MCFLAAMCGQQLLLARVRVVGGRGWFMGKTAEQATCVTKGHQIRVIFDADNTEPLWDVGGDTCLSGFWGCKMWATGPCMTAA